MRKIKKSNVKAAQSVVAMANCTCGYCDCRNCSSLVSGPHQAEMGTNAYNVARSAGYYD